MRPRNVVASMALIAVLVMVAIPGPVGSRVPSPGASLDPGLFHRVEIAALKRGTAATILRQDPEDRSAGTLDQTTALVDPAVAAAPPTAPVRPAQKKPAPGSVSKISATKVAAGGSVGKGGWHHDPNISWYGPGLYGNGTACGQKLTKDLVGVAHRTLPCGTRVTFRYKGVTLTVRVIDRGPYVSGRIFDLSHGACAKLHHCFTGSIDWKLGG